MRMFNVKNIITTPGVGLIGGLLLVFFFLLIFLPNKKIDTKEKLSHDRIIYLKDSIEMEYLKKQLESYPYNHSEIKDITVKN